jgi:hypothetical protein
MIWFVGIVFLNVGIRKVSRIEQSAICARDS